MNIELIEIGSFGFPIIIIFLIIAAIIFIFSFYAIFSGKLKSNVIFDIGLISLFCGFVLSRILGVINNLEFYKEIEWSFLPVRDSSRGVNFITSMPWQLFNVFDGNLVIWGLGFGILLTAFILYLYSNRQQDIFKFLDRVIVAVLPARLVISLGIYISTVYIDSLNNFFDRSLGSFYTDNSLLNLAFIEMVILILGIMIIVFIRLKVEREGTIVAFYLVIEGLIGFLVLSQVSGMNYVTPGIAWHSFVALMLALIGTLILLRTYISPLLRKSNKPLNKRRRNSGENLIQTEAVSDIDFSSKADKRRISNYLKWRKK